jgi:hypothetical protein
MGSLRELLVNGLVRKDKLWIMIFSKSSYLREVIMVTKKMIQEKIADLTEEQLNQVYDMIEQ